MNALLLLFVFALSGLQESNALICYKCTDNGGLFPYNPVDPLCGFYDYAGDSTEEYNVENAICIITMWNSGDVSRYVTASSENNAGDCFYGDAYTKCYCSEDLCNSNSYCDQCQNSTSQTTEITTLPTSEPTKQTTEITTLPTDEPTRPTNILICYKCTTNSELYPYGPYDAECGSYDYSNRHVTLEQNGGNVMCAITIWNSGDVTRYVIGSYLDDGDCFYGNDFTTCYCSGVLCNSHSYCSQCGVTILPTDKPTQKTTEVTTLSTNEPTRPTNALICYKCTTNSELYPYETYDAECGSYDYSNGNATLEQNGGNVMCVITIWNSGDVTRYATVSYLDDGDCYYGNDFTTCLCSGDLCNSHSYCSQCGVTILPTDKPTQKTTEVTTLSTNEPTHQTTEVTTKSTDKPSGLQCFQCISCSSVDESTPIAGDEKFLSCMTTISLASFEVLRGGSYEDRPEVECVQQNQVILCWCSEDFCNGETWAYNQKMLDSKLIINV